jgi:threonine dehydrogenase-like Zn-dependent dehydrogenase
MYKAGYVRIENVPDAKIEHPTDAVIRVTRACICGSDLWPYNEMEPAANGRTMGHEAIGVVDGIGSGRNLCLLDEVHKAEMRAWSNSRKQWMKAAHHFSWSSLSSASSRR